MLICLTTSFYAQNKQKRYFGSHVSWGESDYSAGRIDGLDSKRYTAKGYYTLGFDYTYYISDMTEFCSGLSITNHGMHLDASYFGSRGTYEYDKNFGVFSVPFHLKFHFLKFLFINGGVCFNYHPNMGYRWGVGCGVGIGAEYTFNPAISVSIGYQLQWNSMFSMENSVEIDKLNQKGFAIGLGYRF